MVWQGLRKDGRLARKVKVNNCASRLMHEQKLTGAISANQTSSVAEDVAKTYATSAISGVLTNNNTT
jgi:hypothetical protein